MSSEMVARRSFLGLEGQHVFITGAAGAIGGGAVREFLGRSLFVVCFVAGIPVDCLLFDIQLEEDCSPSLDLRFTLSTNLTREIDNGCRVTAFDKSPLQLSGIDAERFSRLHLLNGDVTDEASIRSGFAQAQERFGPANILVVNSNSGDQTCRYPIWDLPLAEWERNYNFNVRGSFLVIKHFLRAFRQASGAELASPAIVLAETETGTALAGGKTSLLNTVRDEIKNIHPEGRVNAVNSGGLISEKATTPADVARAMAFLASRRAAGHISGQCIRVEGGGKDAQSKPATSQTTVQSIPPTLSKPKRNKIRVAVSIDLDAVSGWLGTSMSTSRNQSPQTNPDIADSHPDNVLADYSAGFFAARVGVPRLLRMLKKLNLADRCTWFIPGHSAESFPDEVKQVVASGCEIGLHGYAHEGAYQLTPDQERDVLTRCMEIAQNLTGKKPVGYRAPLYQLRESTLDLLEEFGFEYGTTLLLHCPKPSLTYC